MNTPDLDWRPLEEDEHAAQIEAVLGLLGPSPLRVLDLGGGDGRVAGPLRDAGHDVLVIDSNPAAVEACKNADLPARRGDVLLPAMDLTHSAGSAQAALCLGYTFMLFVNLLEALDLMRRLRSAIAPDGVFVIENFPPSLWAELHAGAWAEGISEVGDSQMLWREGENVFALRYGDDVDPDNWEIGATDRQHRLWSLSELTLLASLAGFTGPATDESGQLLVFRTLPAH